MARDEKRATRAQDTGDRPVYVVAAGISTVGKYGHISENAEITPADLDGGQASFDELVGRGVIVPKPEAPPAEPAPAEPAPDQSSS